MKYLFIANSILLACVCAFTYNLNKKSKNIKFIDTAYLYNNFKMKQELETTFNDVKSLRQKQLDSLYEYIAALKNVKGTDTRSLEEQYVRQRNKTAEEQENLRATYDSQIWTQLNTLVKEFGKKTNIDLILGANGQGTVMHGKDEMNGSQEAMDFINKKYSGQ